MGFGILSSRFDMAEAVKNNIERSFGDNAGVELLQRTGSGVARIGEGFLSRSLALSIQLQEAGFGEVNFAARFQGWRAGFAFMSVTVKPGGNAANRFEIRGDIITRGAVASSCAGGEDSVFIPEIDGQAIDFWFDDPIQCFVWQESLDAV